MAGKTSFFNLAYFDISDNMSEQVNVQREIDRFTFIDRQLFGYYSIFGNGIVFGLDVYDYGYTSDGGIAIGISSGNAIIGGRSSYLYVDNKINGLSANDSFSIYAYYSNVLDTSSGTIKFYVSKNRINTDSILLATVSTGATSIISIDKTVKERIDFQDYITSEINAHKHRGTPSKIDLTKEVTGKLPNANIESLDASKIVSGKINSKFIPSLKFSEVSGGNSLTPAQIDAFAATLSSSNKNLFGELVSVNLLKQIIFLKRKDVDSDRYMYNELTIVPGYTESSFIDSYSTTATVDNVNECIIGSPIDGNKSHLFTKNFSLPSNVAKVILTSHKNVPYGCNIKFGINTTNSTDFVNYSVIEEDKVQDIASVGSNLRVGVEFEYDPSFPSFDPLNFSFNDYIHFVFANDGDSAYDFHFRVRVYTEPTLANLFLTFFSQSDSLTWSVDGNPIPEFGYNVLQSQSVNVEFYPDLMLFQPFQVYYLVIDVWNGTSFTSESSVQTFITAHGSSVCDVNGFYPQLKNFALMMELDDNKKVQLNLV